MFAKSTSGCKSESPLLTSLQLHEPDEVVLEVFKCAQQEGTISLLDLNKSLNLAVCRPTIAVAEKLVAHGADIDFQDENEWTPLHCAIDAWNLECVCMLLYYNADVSIVCADFSPLFRAVFYKRLDILEILVDYYFDKQLFAEAILVIAKLKGPFAINLSFSEYFSCPDDVKWINVCRRLTHEPGTAHILQAVVLAMDADNCIHLTDLYMLFYNPYQQREQIECIFAILQSSFITKLVERNNQNLETLPNAPNWSGNLISYFIKHSIDKDTRLKLLFSFLGVGFETTIKDIALVYYLYGFGAEFEALIYCSRVHWTNNMDIPRFRHIEDITNFSNESMLYICSTKYADQLLASILYSVVPNLTTFTDTRQKPSVKQIKRKLKKLPLIPSLFQLCKVEIRRSLINSHRYSRVYEYLDAVKTLQLPKVLHNSIIFKDIFDTFKG